MHTELVNAPTLDRETVNMLREMDEIADDGSLILELVDEFLVHSTTLVADINSMAQTQNMTALATRAHSLKGASLNMGTLELFQICERIESLAGGQSVLDLSAEISVLEHVFARTTATLTTLRDRTQRGEDIDDLLD